MTPTATAILLAIAAFYAATFAVIAWAIHTATDDPYDDEDQP